MYSTEQLCVLVAIQLTLGPAGPIGPTPPALPGVPWETNQGETNQFSTSF